jgi:uncharacterized protein YegP (UPF0339 family)
MGTYFLQPVLGGTRFSLAGGGAAALLASEVYPSRSSALLVISAIRDVAVEDSNYERTGPSDGPWSYRLRDAKGDVLAVGPACASEADREQAIIRCKASAPAGEIVDLPRKCA